MPAGSPGVSKMRGSVSNGRGRRPPPSGLLVRFRRLGGVGFIAGQTVFHVGVLAQPPQPGLVLLALLALLDRLAGAGAPGLLGHVAAAAALDLGDVPAELGVERLADLAGLELIDAGLEVGGEGPRRLPAE